MSKPEPEQEDLEPVRRENATEESRRRYEEAQEELQRAIEEELRTRRKPE